MPYHLAELNIARLRAPLDDPLIADFVAGLERINALAESSTGFVWRLKTDSGDATSIKAYDDPNIIVNLSVWESIEALHNYTYYSDHTDFFRRRAEWMEKLSTPYMVMWWIPVGHIPTVEEAIAKLDYLTQHDASPLAFTFRKQFSLDAMLALTQQEG